MFALPPNRSEYVHTFTHPRGHKPEAVVAVHESACGKVAHVSAVLLNVGRVCMRGRFTLHQDGTLFAEYWHLTQRMWVPMLCNSMHITDAIAALEPDYRSRWLVECVHDAVVASPVCC